MELQKARSSGDNLRTTLPKSKKRIRFETPHENRPGWAALMRGVNMSMDQQGKSSPNHPVTVQSGAQID